MLPIKQVQNAAKQLPIFSTLPPPPINFPVPPISFPTIQLPPINNAASDMFHVKAPPLVGSVRNKDMQNQQVDQQFISNPLLPPPLPPLKVTSQSYQTAGVSGVSLPGKVESKPSEIPQVQNQVHMSMLNGQTFPTSANFNHLPG